MSRTNKHILNAKFKSGLIDIEKIPVILKLQWNRHNFNTGKYRAKRKNTLDKLCEIDYYEVEQALIYA